MKNNYEVKEPNSRNFEVEGLFLNTDKIKNIQLRIIAPESFAFRHNVQTTDLNMNTYLTDLICSMFATKFTRFCI